MTTGIQWGPSGQAVFERTYSRPLPDGTKETWADTCKRVAFGNMALVHGADATKWPTEVFNEAVDVMGHMLDFRFLPAGRHLWATGVKGRQFLFNCHVSPWPEKLSEHFSWVFLRLSEGGGVGTNFSRRYTGKYGHVRRNLTVHVVCDPSHPDYEKMKAAGLLSEEFTSDWEGAYEVEDTREGWAAALSDLIDTYMTDDEVQHENRVYDVTNVRPEGARLKTFGGTASGPLPLAEMLHRTSATFNESSRFYMGAVELMEVEHAIAQAVVAGGNRRSARMSIVQWDDDDIFDFIGCKANTGNHWTTNISVAVNDDFFSAYHDRYHEKHHLARAVHQAVVKGMLENGEPGYWNQSLSQEGELSEVVSTNPCGEITLTEREPCVIGSVNLEAFVNEGGDVDWNGLDAAHYLLTRFLIRATFGDVTDPGQRAVLDRNRRIGVGHMGVAGYLAKRGIKWSDAPDDWDFRFDLRAMQAVVRESANKYAFELRIPAPIKVTTVAPTGSIAKLPGVDEGIHPPYARWFEQRIRYSLIDPDQRAAVEKFKAEGHTVEVDSYDSTGNTAVVVFYRKLSLLERVPDPSVVQSAEQISLEDSLKFLRMYQGNYADNAVSFTANIQPGSITQQEAEDLIIKYLPDLKGVTIMVDDSRPQAPYTRLTEGQFNLVDGVKTLDDGVDEDCANGACPIR